jgi:hypothetical protein
MQNLISSTDPISYRVCVILLEITEAGCFSQQKPLDKKVGIQNDISF